MLNFLYDSLETIKKIAIPSRNDIMTLAIATIGMILICGVVLVLFDGGFSALRQILYTIIRQ
ncbi:MAG: preprotein translocase subunit SecE [Candidatus Absconditabacterales bacterium]|nr:preprotein translocase subunit SecE [Candidatus Absconditabacterales bacterium]